MAIIDLLIELAELGMWHDGAVSKCQTSRRSFSVANNLIHDKHTNTNDILSERSKEPR